MYDKIEIDCKTKRSKKLIVELSIIFIDSKDKSKNFTYYIMNDENSIKLDDDYCSIILNELAFYFYYKFNRDYSVKIDKNLELIINAEMLTDEQTKLIRKNLHDFIIDEFTK